MIISLLAMGGYGKYIWPAYLLTLIVFSLNVFLSRQERRRIIKLIKQFNSQQE